MPENNTLGIDLREYGADTDFVQGGRDREQERKIARLAAFADAGGMDTLTDDQLHNIHLGYIREIRQHISAKIAARLRDNYREGTGDQAIAYSMGDRAPIVYTYDESDNGIVGYAWGTPVREGGRKLLMDYYQPNYGESRNEPSEQARKLESARRTLNELSRHGWDINNDPNLGGNKYLLAQRLNLDNRTDGSVSMSSIRQIFQGSADQNAVSNMEVWLNDKGIHVVNDEALSQPVPSAPPRTSTMTINSVAQRQVEPEAKTTTTQSVIQEKRPQIDEKANKQQARYVLNTIASNNHGEINQYNLGDAKALGEILDVNKNGLSKDDLDKIYAGFQEPTQRAAAVKGLTDVLRAAGVEVAESEAPSSGNAPRMATKSLDSNPKR